MNEFRLMIDWDLTAAECRALLALHAAPGGYCNNRELHTAISPRTSTEKNIVKVIICRLRRKIAQYGVEIVTQHGHGYWLVGSSAAIINRAMGEIVHLQVPKPVSVGA